MISTKDIVMEMYVNSRKNEEHYIIYIPSNVGLLSQNNEAQSSSDDHAEWAKRCHEHGAA